MYLIVDKTSDGQQFPLRRFLEVIAGVLRQTDGVWTVTSAYGYGAQVCELDLETEGGHPVEVAPERLLEISSDPSQWFFDLRCVHAPSRLHFGVLDSSGLYLQGPEDICASITANFGEVRQFPDQVNLS